MEGERRSLVYRFTLMVAFTGIAVDQSCGKLQVLHIRMRQGAACRD